jgi:protein arginine N-methyltransferase 1
MAADGVRMDAHVRALERVVKPGTIVLDLGAGTGIVSIIAAKMGARKVHAVDLNPAVLLVADLARENAVAGQIEVHHKSSFELTLEELGQRADVIITDMRASLPLHGDGISLIRDARSRLLAPAGVLFPAKDHLMVALVEAPGLVQDFEIAMEGFKRRALSAEAARASLANSIYLDSSRTLSASNMLSTAGRWATIDYGSPNAAAVVEGTVELTFHRSGRVDALALWFDAVIAEDIGFTTAPGHSSTYSRSLLPLEQSVVVSAGDRATVTVRSDERGGRWAWDTTIVGKSGVKAQLRQSTFLGTPTSAETLLRAASNFKPTLSARGKRLAHALAAMDGAHTVHQIADAVGADVPLAREAILDEVRDASSRYGE